MWGADYLDWYHFSDTLGLTGDLLPVVSNPKASISPNSTMKVLGKTPSLYNSKGKVVGIPDWTSRISTESDVEEWSANEDYGICLIARYVKAIDIDVDDVFISENISDFIKQYLRDNFNVVLPVRFRDNSGKSLFAFRCGDVTQKRILRVDGGLIEFLGDSQQFVVAGTHPSGVPYQWSGLGVEIPELQLADFDKLWDALELNFGAAPSIEAKQKAKVPFNYDEPMYERLVERGAVLSTNKNGSVNIVCPFSHEHTMESAESATVYWPAHTGGFAHASIKCLHAHCAGRSTEQFKEGLGFSPLDDFDDISAEPTFVEPARKGNPNRFKLVPALEYANDGATPKWLIKNLIPQGAVGSIFGPSGSGKSFVTFDLLAAVARGEPWRGRKTQQGHGVYICAEGAFFFRNRIKAYAEHNNISELPIHVLDGQPNLMADAEVNDLIESLKTLGVQVSCIVVDTYAACMVGDENSSIDSTKVINNCKRIRDETGATVIMVHHSGKDVAKGARGWSGLKAAVDFEFQVIKEGDRHAIQVTKQKDGEDGIAFGFSLEDVDLGLDGDLDPIRSCVVVPTDTLPLDDGSGRVNVRDTDIYNALCNIEDSGDEWPSENEFLEQIKKDKGYRLHDLRKALDRLLQRGSVVRESDGTLKIP